MSKMKAILAPVYAADTGPWVMAGVQAERRPLIMAMSARRCHARFRGRERAEQGKEQEARQCAAQEVCGL